MYVDLHTFKAPALGSPEVIGSEKTLFFANTHGPLDQCGGAAGQSVAQNYAPWVGFGRHMSVSKA